jgi:hypothetical protein
MSGERAKLRATFDEAALLEDTGTSGTANTWLNNIGDKDRPSGVCNAP